MSTVPPGDQHSADSEAEHIKHCDVEDWSCVPQPSVERASMTTLALAAIRGAQLLGFLPLPQAWGLTAALLLPCSRPCQLPFPSTVQQHSPMSSQNSSVSGPLHSVSLPLPLPMTLAAPQPPPAASPSQQLGPDAFAIVERAQQMVEILTEENRVLHQELQGYYDNADKLHKVLTSQGPGDGVCVCVCLWKECRSFLLMGRWVTDSLASV